MKRFFFKLFNEYLPQSLFDKRINSYRNNWPDYKTTDSITHVFTRNISVKLEQSVVLTCYSSASFCI